MKKIYFAALFLVLFFSVALVAHSAGGDKTDPVVSQSYLEQIWKDQLLTPFLDKTSTALPEIYNKNLQNICKAAGEANRTAQKNNTGLRRSFGTVVLKQGDVLRPAAGCKITLLSGTIKADTTLVDVTLGAPATGLIPNHLYMQTDAASAGLTAQTAAVELRIDGSYSLTPAAGPDYGSLAAALGEMGLFRGTSTGLDLMGSTTRAQGLVMFLRLMGLEDESLKCTSSVPFTDVPTSHWSRPYVAYAYEKGLTSGVSATAFSPDAPVTAQHYLTFLMRALQYAEGTAFSYATVLTDASKQGLFSAEEIAAMNAGAFLRHKMVYLSTYALLAENAQSGELLLETLIANGTIPEANAHRGLAQINGWRLS